MTTGPGGNPWFLDEATDGIGFLQILPDTTTTLVARPNPSTLGQPVTFTATVAPASGTATLTGSVTFLGGLTTLGTVPLDGSRAGVPDRLPAGISPRRRATPSRPNTWRRPGLCPEHVGGRGRSPFQPLLPTVVVTA